MIFSDTHWIKKYMYKIDMPLRKELLGCYRHSKNTPCIFHRHTNNFRFSFKKIPVIIRYIKNQTQDEKMSVERIIGSKKNTRNTYLQSLNCYNAKLSPKKIYDILKFDSVVKVYYDREVNALLDNAGNSLNAPIAWDTKLTGKNITTAVIDTGIYPHDDLTKPQNRIIGFKDLVKNKKNPYDDNGHGTHVAGCVASNGNLKNDSYRAPAFESLLVGVKALDKTGSGKLSKIISAVGWCIENKNTYNIRIICMSLGSEAKSSYKDDLLCEIVESAWNNGIVVCVAAGNEGPDSSTISSPGIHPLIITVGAINDKNTALRDDDKIAKFSSRGPTKDGIQKPDIVCPGTDIISLRSPSSYLDKRYKSSRVENNYFTLSGTSMATPLCCSCIAILLEKNSQYKPDEIKKIITETSENLGYDRNVQGHGYVDIKSLLDLKNK